ncbi:hypothetical protein L1887_13864 [Cichorium endivia]|nr:hypothetical protein L1887_13864 [Cichorium endivia]
MNKLATSSSWDFLGFPLTVKRSAMENVDILSAFEAAIADGVDIITGSVGKSYAEELFIDTFSIGSFHAMHEERNIDCTSCWE